MQLDFRCENFSSQDVPSQGVPTLGAPLVGASFIPPSILKEKYMLLRLQITSKTRGYVQRATAASTRRARPTTATQPRRKQTFKDPA